MPPLAETVIEAQEDGLLARQAELERLVRGQRWAPAAQAAEQLRVELARADPALQLRHHALGARLAAVSVRAEWQLASADDRARRLELAVLMALEYCPDLSLQDALDVCSGHPPAYESTLRGWTRSLGDWSGRWRRQPVARGRLHREAMRLRLGCSGLEALARRSDEVDVWLAWIDALELAGRASEALRAAELGASRLYWPRHRLQLRLRQGRLAAITGQLDRAHAAWREVWRQRLCLSGLSMVWEAAGPFAAALFEPILEQAYDEERVLPADLQMRLEILLGDADTPLARLQAADLSDWWRQPQHPAITVLPFLLRLGTRQEVLDEGMLLARVWRATDDDGRWRPRPPDSVPTPWSRQVDRVIAQHPTWLVDATAWRIHAATLVLELAAAVLRGGAQSAQLKTAALLIALVESGVAAGDPSAEAPMSTLKRRFPRHRKLFATTERLRASSPLLSHPDGSAR